MTLPRYVVITPARNEERYIEHTLRSMTAQTHTPKEWIVVDDGSTDRTAEIVARHSRRHPWITLVRHHPEEEERKRTPSPVVAAFYAGFAALKTTSWDFIVKLDADLTLPPDYFETVAREFIMYPRTGICGGYIVHETGDGRLERERTAEYHVRGAFKAYRRECFADIGGMPRRKSWDGVDQYVALYKGWKTRVLPLEVVHHRRTGILIDRGLKTSLLVGAEYYREGHSPLLALIRSVIWGKSRKPFGITGAFFLTGFFTALLRNDHKHVDSGMERFIRRFQYQRIRRKLGLRAAPLRITGNPQPPLPQSKNIRKRSEANGVPPAAKAGAVRSASE